MFEYMFMYTCRSGLIYDKYRTVQQSCPIITDRARRRKHEIRDHASRRFSCFFHFFVALLLLLLSLLVVVRRADQSSTLFSPPLLLL